MRGREEWFVKSSLQGLPRQGLQWQFIGDHPSDVRDGAQGDTMKTEMNLRRGEKPNRNAKELGSSLIVLGAIEEWET